MRTKINKIIALAMVMCELVLILVALTPPRQEHQNDTDTPESKPLEEEPVEIVPEIIPAAVLTPATRLWTDREANLLAKMLWGETRGNKSVTEIAACVWCVLNRVDYYDSTITDIVTAPHQFAGCRSKNPVDPYLKEIAEDVLARWFDEKDGNPDAGRVLPADYMWFTGDGKHNIFTNAFKDGQIWDWSLPSPYES